MYSQDENKDTDLAGECNPEDGRRSRGDGGIIHLSVKDTRD